MAETIDASFSYKPLYVQVKDSLVRRLIDGAWQPGQLIPSEMELAREIGVSQGTIRKALDAMAADHLLVRRQGRGTYVAEPEESRILFRYFRMTPDSGEHSFPTSRILRCSTGLFSRSKATRRTSSNGVATAQPSASASAALAPTAFSRSLARAMVMPHFSEYSR